MIKLSVNNCYETVANESELALLLYEFPELDPSNLIVADSFKYNAAVDSLYLDWRKLSSKNYESDPQEFHTQVQQTWLMPETYMDLDIAKWVLDQCADQNELQRAGQELLEYQNRDLLPLLTYLKYLVDTARTNNIVLGVGRGSSVASFVLYLIGVHRIHSLRHNLDFSEFMR